jgi:hypothetical protein
MRPLRSVKSRNLTFRIPPALADAVEQAAERDLLSLSDYIRIALLTRLRAQGQFVNEPVRA